ncbi:basic proline-rich protein-like [Neopsephotus bourkii]|uniref:basic proline-rich protein-like n=1 Tax=Neopsephotus bourkii TaxID=309878 RepID=UPI002AA55FBB|nr:basic proline-rich protein-like [Neopsephotus bourkii]
MLLSLAASFSSGPTSAPTESAPEPVPCGGSVLGSGPGPVPLPAAASPGWAHPSAAGPQAAAQPQGGHKHDPRGPALLQPATGGYLGREENGRTGEWEREPEPGPLLPGMYPLCPASPLLATAHRSSTPIGRAHRQGAGLRSLPRPRSSGHGPAPVRSALPGMGPPGPAAPHEGARRSCRVRSSADPARRSSALNQHGGKDLQDLSFHAEGPGQTRGPGSIQPQAPISP